MTTQEDNKSKFSKLKSFLFRPSEPDIYEMIFELVLRVQVYTKHKDPSCDASNCVKCLAEKIEKKMFK